MKKIIILLMLCILSALSVSASNDWRQYQNNYESYGSYDTNYIGDFENINSTDFYANGKDFQPIVADFDNDNQMEILIQEGNYLNIFHYDASNGLEIETQLYIGAQSPSTPYVDDIDGDGFIEIIIAYNQSTQYIFTLQYNGTHFNSEQSAILTAHPVTAIKCGDNSGTYECFFGDTAGQFVVYDPILGTKTAYSVSSGSAFDTTNNEVYPNTGVSLVDYDGDGNLEFIAPTDFVNNDNEGIIVIDTVTHARDTLFNGVGYLDNIETGSGERAEVQGLFTANLNGVGDHEICLTYITIENLGSDFPQECWLQCYNSDGTAYASRRAISNMSIESFTTNLKCSNPVYVDVDGIGNDICAMANHDRSGADDDEFYITCYNTYGGTIPSSPANIYKEVDFREGYWGTGKITSADMDGNGYADLIAPTTVFLSNGGTSFTRLDTWKSSGTGNTIPADVNNDGYLDLVHQYTSALYTIFSDDVNTPPQMHNNYTGGGYLGYYSSPVCVDSAITYYANEQGSNSNYDNDVRVDEERLLTNCGLSSGLDDNLETGAFSQFNPSFTCVYNETGIYNVRIYMEDNPNTGDRTQYNTDTITIRVMDGIEGETCNVQETYINSINDLEKSGDAASSENAQYAAATSFFDLLTGGHPLLKLFIGLVLCGVAMFAGWELSNNLTISIIAMELMMFGLTLLKVLDLAIFIVFTILTLLSIILIRMLSGNGGD